MQLWGPAHDNNLFYHSRHWIFWPKALRKTRCIQEARHGALRSKLEGAIRPGVACDIAYRLPRLAREPRAEGMAPERLFSSSSLHHSDHRDRA